MKQKPLPPLQANVSCVPKIRAPKIRAPKILVLTGPTASGKTKMAIELAKILDGEIICADSRIVYKNFDIVSAKPTVSEREGVLHHLVDIIDIADIGEGNAFFSAGDFVEGAKRAIKEIQSRGKRVIISGGTWFYIKSLLDDETLPECKINSKLRSELEQEDEFELWRRLNELDSYRAIEIHPHNKDKVIRSIEMCITLGMPISAYLRKSNTNLDAMWFCPDVLDETRREDLYNNIDKRVDDMISLGLYAEFKKNRETFLKFGYNNPDLKQKSETMIKLMKSTIGYAEFFELEDGVWADFDEAVEKIKQRTRNFAKRQLSFFRNYKNIMTVKSTADIINIIKET